MLVIEGNVRFLRIRRILILDLIVFVNEVGICNRGGRVLSIFVSVEIV